MQVLLLTPYKQSDLGLMMFRIPRNAAQVAADSVNHEKPPERENSLRSFYSNFQKFLGKVCKFQLGILKSAFISCTMGYKFQ